MSKIEISYLSKFRSELMGVASILIILCHAPAHGVVSEGFLHQFLLRCDVGVDIFLLLSGLGLYFSLDKRKIKLITWYKGRYLKLFVPYLLFAVPTYAWIAIKNQQSFIDFLFNLSTISYWIDGVGLWFVAMLIPLYFTSPLVYKCAKNGNAIFLLAVTTIIAMIVGSFAVDGFIRNVFFVIMRYPSFVLGMLCANGILSNIEIKKKVCIIILFTLTMFVILRLIIHIQTSMLSVYWILCLAVLIMLEKIFTISPMFLNLFFRHIGRISLESYCTNVYWVGCIMLVMPIDTPSVISYTLSTFLCLIFSYGLYKVNLIIIQFLK